MSDTPEILHQISALRTDIASLNAIHNSRVSIGLTGDQSVNSGVTTRLQFNNELIDNLGEWDSANYEFTPKVDGDYIITIVGRIDVLGDQKTFEMNTYDDAGLLHQSINTASGANYVTSTSSIMRSLTTASKINFKVWHNHGVARNIGSNGTKIYIFRKA